MKRTILLVIIYSIAMATVKGMPFEFRETNLSFVSNLLQSVYKNVYLGNLEVRSSFIKSFVEENWNLKKFSSYLALSNSSMYFQIISDKTNITLKRLPIPLVEGIELFFSLTNEGYLRNFRKFGIADYGNTKILNLAYSENAHIIAYISDNFIQRLDYWIKEGKENIMVWSYLCAYSTSKTNDKVFLSSILLNIQAKEFYKFDFNIY
ncbi:MAG: hypothetical protein ABDH28_07880 [Brevinematia bacterium]